MALQRKKKNIVLVSIILLVIIGGIIIAEKTSGKRAAKVSTENAARRNVEQKVSASGKVQPVEEIKLSPDVAGEITDLMVKEGDSVIQGQLLARINAELFNADVDRSRATYENTKANLEASKARVSQAQSRLTEETTRFARTKKLHDQKVIPDAEWEAAQASISAARAELDASFQNVKALEFSVKGMEASLNQSKKQLQRTNIYAPRSGTISKLGYKKGERVWPSTQMAGAEILRIADLNNMEVAVDVNENDISKIRFGDSATIEIEAYKGKTFQGVVTDIANTATVQGLSADQVTNFAVKVRIVRASYLSLILPGRPYPFRPGMTANVEIKTRQADQVITVPIEAVTTRDASDLKPDSLQKVKKVNPDKAKEAVEVVFLFIEGKARIKKVKTGIQDDTYIEITEGLKEGDEVITAPFQEVSTRLKEGMEVQKTARDKLFGKKE